VPIVHLVCLGTICRRSSRSIYSYQNLESEFSLIGIQTCFILSRLACSDARRTSRIAYQHTHPPPSPFQVHSNVKQSDRLLTGMESWFGGAVRSMFRPSRRGDVFASEGRTGSERPFSAAPSIRLDGHTRDPPSRWRQATEGHEGQDRRFGATPTQQPNHDAMEDISRVVAGAAAWPCYLACDMNSPVGVAPLYVMACVAMSSLFGGFGCCEG